MLVFVVGGFVRAIFGRFFGLVLIGGIAGVAGWLMLGSLIAAASASGWSPRAQPDERRERRAARRLVPARWAAAWAEAGWAAGVAAAVAEAGAAAAAGSAAEARRGDGSARGGFGFR